MKRNIWIAVALGTVLAACAAPAPSPTAAPQAIKTDFTASDPAAVNLAAGKPQLVEFYAVW